MAGGSSPAVRVRSREGSAGQRHLPAPPAGPALRACALSCCGHLRNSDPRVALGGDRPGRTCCQIVIRGCWWSPEGAAGSGGCPHTPHLPGQRSPPPSGLPAAPHRRWGRSSGREVSAEGKELLVGGGAVSAGPEGRGGREGGQRGKVGVKHGASIPEEIYRGARGAVGAWSREGTAESEAGPRGSAAMGMDHGQG